MFAIPHNSAEFHMIFNAFEAYLEKTADLCYLSWKTAVCYCLSIEASNRKKMRRVIQKRSAEQGYEMRGTEFRVLTLALASTWAPFLKRIRMISV